METTDFKSTQEFFDLWSKTYGATYGKLLEMPAVGPMRERSEKMAKGYSIFSDLYSSWIESYANLQKVFGDARRQTYEKTASEMKGEVGPEKYKEFYHIWMETYSQTFKEFLKSDQFTSDMGSFVAHFMDYQQFNREMLEENYLKPMNMPTKTEVDEIVKEVYLLKRKVKELTSQIHVLSEKK
jgi:hypothetical protein